MSDDPILTPHAGTDGPTPRPALVRGQYLLFRGTSQRERGEVLAALRAHVWRMRQARTLDDLDQDRRVPWQSN